MEQSWNHPSNRVDMKWIAALLFLCSLANCARKNTMAADQQQKEENRKQNKDNFLLAQAHDIVEDNADNKNARERKKEKRKQNMLDFLHHMNKKKDPATPKAFVPPFKP